MRRASEAIVGQTAETVVVVDYYLPANVQVERKGREERGEITTEVEVVVLMVVVDKKTVKAADP